MGSTIFCQYLECLHEKGIESSKCPKEMGVKSRDMAVFVRTKIRLFKFLLALLFLLANLFLIEASQLFAGGPPRLKVSKSAVVRVAIAKKTCFDDMTEITGGLVPKQEVLVRPDREGFYIWKVLVEPGAKVNAGQALAQLMNPETPSDLIAVQAPVAGVIRTSNAVVGAIASARTSPLFQIIGGGELELSAQISTKYLSKLSSSLPARIKVVGIGELAGKVRFVSNTVDPSTQLGEVRLSIGFDERLKAGMLGRAFITSGQRCDAIAVPLSALLYSEEGAVVQVVRDEKVESQFVTVGLRSVGSIEIRQGVAEGDMVVSRAGAFLRDGDRVTPVVEDDSGK
jgi:HlyD family secretion protein